MCRVRFCVVDVGHGLDRKGYSIVFTLDCFGTGVAAEISDPRVGACGPGDLWRQPVDGVGIWDFLHVAGTADGYTGDGEARAYANYVFVGCSSFAAVFEAELLVLRIFRQASGLSNRDVFGV